MLHVIMTVHMCAYKSYAIALIKTKGHSSILSSTGSSVLPSFTN